MTEIEKLLAQEREIVKLRDFSHLKFVREAWFQRTSNPNNAMGAYTSLLDAQVLAYAIGGNLRRVWYLLAYDGYLDGVQWPAAIDHITSRSKLVSLDIGLRRATPLAKPDDKPLSNLILSREKRYADECNAHHSLRAEQLGRERYKARFPVVEVAAVVPQKSWLQKLWS